MCFYYFISYYCFIIINGFFGGNCGSFRNALSDLIVAVDFGTVLIGLAAGFRIFFCESGSLVT